MINAGDTSHPSDFFIAYWGPDGRTLATHVDDLYRDHTVGEPCLPQYLTTDTNIVGKSNGPPTLKSSFETTQARFSLHSRVQSSFACMMCTSTPESLSSWFEGEQFYIKCCHHSLKMDGYLAVNKIDVNTYQATTITTVSGIDQEKTGALFRLYSTEVKKRENADTTPNDS